MDDGALAGTRVLVVGGPREAAEGLRAQLSAAGSPSVDLVPVLDLVAVQAAAAQPEVVIALSGDAAGGGAAAARPARASTPGRRWCRPTSWPRRAARLDEAGVRRLTLRLEHRAMRRRLGELEAIVASQALSAFRDTEAVRVDALRRLALAAEYRDDNSPEHTQRVASLAARMARHITQDDRLVWLVRNAAPLHDLGKIAIPDSILLKPGKLADEEFEVVKTHAVLGARVLADGNSEVLGVAERIARSHHERWDGTGYPDGLQGEAIPLEARLVHVADVFDVLVHERPYKEAWTVEDAAGEIRAGAGSQFDPVCVAAFDALGAGSWTTG